jgi:hypothetical protein
MQFFNVDVSDGSRLSINLQFVESIHRSQSDSDAVDVTMSSGQLWNITPRSAELLGEAISEYESNRSNKR